MLPQIHPLTHASVLDAQVRFRLWESNLPGEHIGGYYEYQRGTNGGTSSLPGNIFICKSISYLTSMNYTPSARLMCAHVRQRPTTIDKPAYLPRYRLTPYAHVCHKPTS